MEKERTNQKPVSRIIQQKQNHSVNGIVDNRPYSPLSFLSNPTAQRVSEEDEETMQGKFDSSVQRMEDEDEEPLQGKFESPVQRVSEEDEDTLQGKFEKPIQKKNETGMPDNLKAGIENLSGFSMDNVRVHYNSSKPATVQALAYTQGTDIHVAPGQEKHLPHEAWHVAQQMAGRVSPTTSINGMPVNDNIALEHEADVMGKKAVQCKREKDECLTKQNSFRNVLQCKIEWEDEIKNRIITLKNGCFIMKELTPLSTEKGASLKRLDFRPNFKGANADSISLVQIVKESDEETTRRQENEGFEKRKVLDGECEGWAVDSDWIYHMSNDGPLFNRRDHLNSNNWKNHMRTNHTVAKLFSPKIFINKDFRYSEIRLSKDTPIYAPPTDKQPDKQHNGWSITCNEKGTWSSGCATIRDQPQGKNAMDFKVMALLNDNINLGVVEWGYKYDESMQKCSVYFKEGEDVTKYFIAAAKQWNTIILDKTGTVVDQDKIKAEGDSFVGDNLVSEQGNYHKLFHMPEEYKDYPTPSAK